MPKPILNPILYLFVTAILATQPLAAQSDALDEAIDRLPIIADVDLPALERRIVRLRSESGSPSRDLLLARGRDAAERGEYDVALAQLSALIDHAPDFAEAYYERAGVFFVTGRYGLALNDLAHVFSHAPRHYDAIFMLAATQMEMGRYDAAWESVAALRAIHPRYEPLESFEGELARRTGRKQL